MRCPYCFTDDDKVIDSRPNKENTAIRRRRMCNSCSKRFTTYEYIEKFPIQVIKKDGRREDFSRQKILNGLMIACRKRSIPYEKLEQIVEDIHEALIKSGQNEITVDVIGEYVTKHLKELDQVAYVRFASVYKEFKDIEEFKKAIDNLSKSLEK
ncbi:MAG: transcriptional repressor NrdR [Spirochaetes bacterium]|nr:transcriptional repressor NrdR [Spirochaetota bacterium]